MKDETDTSAIWRVEFSQQQKQILDRTRQTDLTTTEIKEMVDQLPDLLKPDGTSTGTLGERLLAVLSAVEAAIAQSMQQQKQLEKTMKDWEEKMARHHAQMDEQQKDLGELLEAIRVKE